MLKILGPYVDRIVNATSLHWLDNSCWGTERQTTNMNFPGRCQHVCFHDQPIDIATLNVDLPNTNTVPVWVWRRLKLFSWSYERKQSFFELYRILVCWITCTLIFQNGLRLCYNKPLLELDKAHINAIPLWIWGRLKYFS